MRVLVVGSGFAGSSIAHFLARRQSQVTLVSNPVFDSQSSTRVSAGIIVPLSGRRKVPVFNAHQTTAFAWNHYQSLQAQSGFQLILDKTVLEIIHDFKEYNDWYAKSSDPQLEAFFTLAPKTLTSAIKSHREGFVLYRNAFCVLPQLVLRAYQVLNDSIVHRDETFQFDRLQVGKNSVEYGGELFDALVFCEGYRAILNPFWNHLPFKPVKGEILDIVAPEFQLNHILNGDLYIIPIGNDRYRVGATYQWTDLNEIPSTEGRDQLLHKLEKLIPCEYQTVAHQASVRPAIQDRRPVIGKHHEFNSIWIFNGLGTKGALYSPYYGNQLAQAVLGEGEIDPEVDVARFKI